MDDLRSGTSNELPLRPKRADLKYPSGRFLTFTKGGREGETVMLDLPSPYEHGRSPFVAV